MARAITAPELAYLRSDGQATKLYLALPDFGAVWTGIVSGTYATSDKVASITYTSGSATGTAKAGMTLLVGTTPGGCDVGRVRARGTPSGSVLLIGENSDITWAAGQYLTLINDYDLWIRAVTNSGSTAFMDYSIAYTNQHSTCDPVPVMGPAAVAWLANGEAQAVYDASPSWVIGSSITGYAWSVSGSGASVTGGSSGSAATITATAAGAYQVQCIVTAANGKTTTGHRPLIVVDPANLPDSATQFTVDSCVGDYASGNWTAKITCYAGASLPNVQDGQVAVLHAQDWYGNTQISLGAVLGRENVVLVGRIAGTSIHWEPDYSSVSFDVQGPAWWLDRIDNFPASIADTTGVPADWLHIQALTVDKMLWDLFHWRSTVDTVLDFYPPQSTLRAQSFQTPGSMSLWQQALLIARPSILAQPACDRYGRLFVEVDQQYLAEAYRVGLPVVQDLTTVDWRDALDFKVQWLPAVAMLDVSGIYWTGTAPTPYFSLAPGHVFKARGGFERIDRLLVTNNQAASNGLAGRILGQRNNNYPSVPVALGENNRFMDIAPRQYVTMSMSAADNARGEVWAAKKFIPRTVTLAWNEAGYLLTELDLEGETFTQTAITGDAPQSPPADPTTPETVVPYDPTPSGPIGGTDLVYALTSAGFGRTRTFTTSASAAGPTWENVTGIIEGTLSDFCLDPYNCKNFAMLVGTSGVWATSGNSLDATPSWLCVQTVPQFEAATLETLDTVQSVWGTAAQQGLFYALALAHTGATYGAYVGTTVDYGATWAWTRLGDTTGATDVHGLACSQYNAGTVLASAGVGLIYKSTDYGANFTSMALGAAQPAANIEIPYEGNGSDLVVYVGGQSTGGSAADHYVTDITEYTYTVDPNYFIGPPNGLRAEASTSFVGAHIVGAFNDGAGIITDNGDWTCYDCWTNGGFCDFYDATDATWVRVFGSVGRATRSASSTGVYLTPGHLITHIRIGYNAQYGIDATALHGTPMGNYILRSTDGAASFTDITPAEGGPGGFRGLHSDVLDSDHITALVGEGVASLDLVESINGGATWGAASQSGLAYAAALGRWPYNATTLYLLQAGAINASGDNGATLADQTGNFADAVGAITDPRNIVPVWMS